MTTIRFLARNAALVAWLVTAIAAANAQEGSSPGLLDNLFSSGNGSARQSRAAPAPADNELSVRIDRLENQLRQLTGQIEQLQFRNQQLEQQVMRLQGGAPVASGEAPVAPPPLATAPAVGSPAPPSTSGRRSDAFDPTQHPDAPGVPRALGGGAVASAVPMAPAVMPPAQDDVPIGAPGGRAAGAPLDLSTMAGAAPPPGPQYASPSSSTGTMGAPIGNGASGALPPPPPRNSSATGAQLATLPPSHSAKDEYDLAYGYVLHKDYALAEKAFADFVRRNPKDKLVPEAHYWLGESFFQRQRYQDAADSYLVVVRNYDDSAKAPDALLRLGQSLAALGQKEMACASLGEVGRKYPQAAANVKRGVAQEQKRVHC